MKFNVIVELEEYDNIYKIEEKVTNKIASQIVNELICNNKKEFRDNMINYVKQIMCDTINTPQFKQDVTEAVTQRLTRSYNKSKECTEIINAFDIKSNSEIIINLQNMISESVGRELQKRFK